MKDEGRVRGVLFGGLCSGSEPRRWSSRASRVEPPAAWAALGGSWVVIRVALRVPLQGSIGVL